MLHVLSTGNDNDDEGKRTEEKIIKEMLGLKYNPSLFTLE